MTLFSVPGGAVAGGLGHVGLIDSDEVDTLLYSAMLFVEGNRSASG
jgi:hypothetical protein